MEGIPAFDLWDVVMDVLHSSLTQPRAQGNLCRDTLFEKRSNGRTQKLFNLLEDLGLTNVDYFFKRKTFSTRCDVVHFRRQLTSNKDDC